MESNRMLDVVVVGAGISGLTAAYELFKVCPELRILVLEAKGRVGGRTLTQKVDIGDNRSEEFDFGGQWVATVQPDIMEVLDDLGLETFPQFIRGKKILEAGPGDRVRSYEANFPQLDSIRGRIELQLFIWKVERLCKEVSVEDPYSSPVAEKYDRTTMETFLRGNLKDPSAYDCMEAACRTNFGADVGHMSLLYFLAFCSAAGGMMKLFLAHEGYAIERRVKGGTQQISRLLAERIGLDRVRFNEPVQEIEQEGDRLILKTSTGNTYTTSRVIVSAPPRCVSRIKFQPPLPESRRFLLENMPVGHMIKFIVTYDKAYWREAGFSGEVVSNGGSSRVAGCSRGPISLVYDDTTDSNVPALVGFVAGRASLEWHSTTAAERKAAVLEGLHKCFGPWAAEPTSYTEKLWAHEPYNGGCPVSFAVPGVMHAFHALRTPHGRIHWCGTETATHWTGYMSGAVQSGRRAALELLGEFNLEVPDLLEKRVWRKPVNSNNPPDFDFINFKSLIVIVIAVISYVVFRSLSTQANK